HKLRKEGATQEFLRRPIANDRSPEAQLTPGQPGCLRGTSTRRLNSATSAPSWLSTRVWTRTVPRSGLDCEGFTSSTSDSQNSVSPWNTGAGCLSSSVARLAIALPLTSETLIPRASEYTSGPTTTLRPCCDCFAYTSLRCSG